MTDPSKAWKYKPPLAGKLGQVRTGGRAIWQAVADMRTGKPRKHRPRETDLREFWECRALWSIAKANVDIGVLDRNDDRTPEVTEDGMSGRIGQRKPGTTRGSPRRSCTAKASRISRHAVKSRCAREWDGWGRLSDDGPGHHNPDSSEGPWGGGEPT